MNVTAERLVEEYLRDLRKELRDLPRAQRREVLAEIEEHIADARAEGGDEVDIRNVLDRLGDPADIADDARERFGVRRRSGGVREVRALVLLPLGGVILPVFGWFAGVILLWASDAWTAREKWVGTLIVPGGLLLPVYLAIGVPVQEEACRGSGNLQTGQSVRQSCSGGMSSTSHALWIALFVALVIAPIAVAVWLGRRMHRPAVPA